MGLFSFYLGYRHAKKKAARRQRQQEWDEWDEEDICENCGYELRQHSDSGQCPQYS